jgi:hypothetical protein
VATVPEEQQSLIYKAEPTARLFHRSNSFVRGIRGPVGSGKTTAAILELYTRALEQAPFNGVRRSRWALIRSTYPELLSTTLKTFEEWIPRQVCRVVQSAPIRGMLNVDLPDGTKVEAEFLFLALDQEDDVKKLKSLELTGGFINEASETRRSILEMLTSRVGRYPSKQMGGASWSGIIMDTNPPDDSHWWYKLAEVEKPAGYEFWSQPPAMIKCFDKDKRPFYVPNDGSHGQPAAENIQNHNAGFGYYERMVPGKDPEWIKVYILGEYGSVFSGKPVYPEFSPTVHIAKEELQPYRGLPLILAWDFGLTPSCAIMQMTPRGQLRILDEKSADNMGIERFARDVMKPFLATAKYTGIPFVSIGDPAGRQRSQTNEVTCMEMLEMQGFRTEAAPTNEFIPRREAVAWFLSKLTDGEPGFQLSPTCETLKRGFMGGYQYRRMKAPGGGDKFAESPDKNEFSHLQDCVQYGCCHLRSSSRGASFNGGELIGAHNKREVVKKNYSAWS